MRVRTTSCLQLTPIGAFSFSQWFYDMRLCPTKLRLPRIIMKFCHQESHMYTETEYISRAIIPIKLGHHFSIQFSSGVPWPNAVVMTSCTFPTVGRLTFLILGGTRTDHASSSCSRGSIRDAYIVRFCCTVNNVCCSSKNCLRAAISQCSRWARKAIGVHVTLCAPLSGMAIYSSIHSQRGFPLLIIFI